jgi:hypothetical protein
MRITEVNGGHPVPSDLAVFDAGYPEIVGGLGVVG